MFIDTWDVLAGRDGGWAAYVIDPRDGLGKAVRMADGFHPNETGCEILATEIAGQPSAPTSPREAQPSESSEGLSASEVFAEGFRRTDPRSAANPRMRSAGGRLDHRPGQRAAHLLDVEALGDEAPEAPAGPVVDVAGVLPQSRT